MSATGQSWRKSFGLATWRVKSTLVIPSEAAHRYRHAGRHSERSEESLSSG